MAKQPLPKTVEEALNFLLCLLDKDTMEIFASRSKTDLQRYHRTAGALIIKEFELTAGNDALIESCRQYSGQPNIGGKGASIVILEALWESLRQTKH